MVALCVKVMEINDITGKIIESAVTVHSVLGPGLFEEVYKRALLQVLSEAGLIVKSEVPIPVIFDDIYLECGYRVDLLVESEVIVELKVVERVTKLHRAQLITYLKLAHKQVGLLINFNTPYLAQGIHRLVNNYRGPLPQRPPPTPRSSAE